MTPPQLVVIPAHQATIENRAYIAAQMFSCLFTVRLRPATEYTHEELLSQRRQQFHRMYRMRRYSHTNQCYRPMALLVGTLI